MDPYEFTITVTNKGHKIDERQIKSGLDLLEVIRKYDLLRIPLFKPKQEVKTK